MSGLSVEISFSTDRVSKSNTVQATHLPPVCDIVLPCTAPSLIQMSAAELMF